MTNPPPSEQTRPPRESRSDGELKLTEVPKVRILGWLVLAAVTLTGLVLYFLFGDYITPVLVMHHPNQLPDLDALVG